MKILCITPIKHLEGAYEHLETFGQVDYKPEIKKEEMIETNLDEYDIIFCNPNKQPFVLNKETLGRFEGKIITASTGLNHIDIVYCQKEGIEILSQKEDYGLINYLPSTSELAFGLMLSLLRKIPQGQKHTSEYNWDYTSFIGRQVKDLNIGIVGYGRLGKMMYKFCKAFEANVFVCDPYISNVDTISLEEMISKCDVVSLHVHVTDETKKIINMHSLRNIKKPLYMINTSRGEVVDENDIVLAIKSGLVAGYGTDVIVDEFNDVGESPIIKAMNEGYNIIVTPHIGGMTWEGQKRAYMWSINKLKGLL
jgi:D-3-phosphoglycerate dehydrogenase